MMRAVRKDFDYRAARLCAALLCLVPLCACGSELDAEPEATLRYLAFTYPRAFSSRLSDELSKALPEVKIVPEATAGSLYIVNALNEGNGDFGFAQADVVYMAYRKGIPPEHGPHTNLRAIAVRWVNVVHIVVREDSPIHEVADLRGRRVGVVPPGSSGEQFARTVLEAHGINYSALEIAFHSYEQLADELSRGTLDAAIAVGAAPALKSKPRTRLLPVTRKVTNEMRKNYPFAKPMILPASDWHGLRDVETVGADSLLICRKDLPEEIVYRIAKAFFEVLPELSRQQPRVAQIDPSDAPATPIPLHPGAARYYRERQILR
jgi:TRAP transporter TAXI family solute receptor